MDWTVVATCSTLAGCCLNVVFLEHLIRASSNSGNMIVFFQFLFISIEGFIFQSKFGTKKRVIPFRKYVVMVVMYFTASVSNIISLDCNVPMPLHMIFKSGSLVANLLLGCVLLRRSYPATKFVSVFLVTIGITICTFATTQKSPASTGESGASSEATSTGGGLLMLLGIFLISFSLLISARLGVFQEVLFLEYGKQSREALFYNHAIPLPFFAILAPSILQNISILNQSERSIIPLVSWLCSATLGLDVQCPILWQYMLCNVLTQYICIRSIFLLLSHSSSLSVTLLLTLRKFISLIFSVFYFGNNFQTLHWIGTAFVFLGTLLYTDVIKTLLPYADVIKQAIFNCDVAKSANSLVGARESSNGLTTKKKSE